MNRQQLHNDFNKKAEYYGYSPTNIISRAVLVAQDTPTNRARKITSVVQIRPARNRKAGAQ